MLCDFCNAEGPVWSYHAIPIHAVPIYAGGPGGTTICYDAEWAACEACAALVDARDRAGLAERVVATFEERDRERVRDMIAALYERLLPTMGRKERVRDPDREPRGPTTWEFNAAEAARARATTSPN